MYYSQSTTKMRRSATLMTESSTLSLSVYAHFLYTASPLCDCLYRGKNVNGGICYGHISHLVQKTDFRQITTPKK